MARRSHNETFILLRNNAQKNRSFYRDFNKDDERVKLVANTGDDDDDDDGDGDVEIYDMELGNKSLNPNGQATGEMAFPSWMASLDEFRYESFNIKEKIEQLKKIQLEHLKQQNTAIFADEATNDKSKEYEMEIDRRCQELNILFNRLHSILMHFKMLKNYCLTGKGFNNKMISIILRNIFQYQVQEVVHLTQLFRSCQRVYVERRNEHTKIDPEFVITFDTDLLEQEFQNDDRRILSATSFDDDDDDVFSASNSNAFTFTTSNNAIGVGQQQLQLQRQRQTSSLDQIQLDAHINAHLKEREKEMNSIMKSFAELNQLFQEVNTLVIDQGSALDRIDYNIEQVEHKVELGAVSLEKAHRSLTRVRKLKLILGAGFVLFLLFLLIIIRS